MTTFQVGDRVTLLATAGIVSHEKHLGRRFEVLEVIDIPDSSDPYDVSISNLTPRESAGHHQHVIIEYEGERRKFSGAYFDPDSRLVKDDEKIRRDQGELK